MRPRLAVTGAVAGVIGVILGIAALLIWWRFDRDIKLASARVARGSLLIATRCGPIEYQGAGTGVPLLAVHGSGGGYDQGMAFSGALAHQGIRVIAMSRFGYLRTPMPTDASAAAQADALTGIGPDSALVLAVADFEAESEHPGPYRENGLRHSCVAIRTANTPSAAPPVARAEEPRRDAGFNGKRTSRSSSLGRSRAPIRRSILISR